MAALRCSGIVQVQKVLHFRSTKLNYVPTITLEKTMSEYREIEDILREARRMRAAESRRLTLEFAAWVKSLFVRQPATRTA